MGQSLLVDYLTIPSAFASSVNIVQQSPGGIHC